MSAKMEKTLVETMKNTEGRLRVICTGCHCTVKVRGNGKSCNRDVGERKRAELGIDGMDETTERECRDEAVEGALKMALSRFGRVYGPWENLKGSVKDD